MLLEQLVRLIGGLCELGIGLILMLMFLIGSGLLCGGFTIGGLLIMLAVIWFVASAINRDR